MKYYKSSNDKIYSEKRWRWNLRGYRDVTDIVKVVQVINSLWSRYFSVWGITTKPNYTPHILNVSDYIPSNVLPLRIALLISSVSATPNEKDVDLSSIPFPTLYQN